MEKYPSTCQQYHMVCEVFCHHMWSQWNYKDPQTEHPVVQASGFKPWTLGQENIGMNIFWSRRCCKRVHATQSPYFAEVNTCKNKVLMVKCLWSLLQHLLWGNTSSGLILDLTELISMSYSIATIKILMPKSIIWDKVNVTFCRK